MTNLGEKHGGISEKIGYKFQILIHDMYGVILVGSYGL
jgi:hypothetical protein